MFHAETVVYHLWDVILPTKTRTLLLNSPTNIHFRTVWCFCDHLAIHGLPGFAYDEYWYSNIECCNKVPVGMGFWRTRYQSGKKGVFKDKEPIRKERGVWGQCTNQGGKGCLRTMYQSGRKGVFEDNVPIREERGVWGQCTNQEGKGR